MILENNSMLKKVASGILLLAIVLVVTVLVASYFRKNKVTETKPQFVSDPAPVKTEYQGTLPPEFPTTIPIEKDTRLSQSYSKKYVKIMQSSIVLYSPKTKDENFTYYENFLKTNGWTVTKSVNGSTTASLIATKGSETFDAMILDRTGMPKYSKATTTPPLSHVVINVIKE